jgi:hypothetical protein
MGTWRKVRNMDGFAKKWNLFSSQWQVITPLVTIRRRSTWVQSLILWTHSKVYPSSLLSILFARNLSFASGSAHEKPQGSTFLPPMANSWTEVNWVSLRRSKCCCRGATDVSLRDGWSSLICKRHPWPRCCCYGAEDLQPTPMWHACTEDASATIEFFSCLPSVWSSGCLVLLRCFFTPTIIQVLVLKFWNHKEKVVTISMDS